MVTTKFTKGDGMGGLEVGGFTVQGLGDGEFNMDGEDGGLEGRGQGLPPTRKAPA